MKDIITERMKLEERLKKLLSGQEEKVPDFPLVIELWMEEKAAAQKKTPKWNMVD